MPVMSPPSRSLSLARGGGKSSCVKFRRPFCQADSFDRLNEAQSCIGAGQAAEPLADSPLPALQKGSAQVAGCYAWQTLPPNGSPPRWAKARANCARAMASSSPRGLARQR
ncbi:hypothetical protein ERY430_50051 [Erythrobacter sp. EC-HK427]|nr:hypothetical protein ERY430_50051 [Erythrobacter sp. EC-HK427]